VLVFVSLAQIMRISRFFPLVTIYERDSAE